MTEIQEVAQAIIDNTVRGKQVVEVTSRKNVVIIVYAWDGIEEVEVSGNEKAIAEELRRVL